MSRAPARPGVWALATTRSPPRRAQRTKTLVRRLLVVDDNALDASRVGHLLRRMENRTGLPRVGI